MLVASTQAISFADSKPAKPKQYSGAWDEQLSVSPVYFYPNKKDLHPNDNWRGNGNRRKKTSKHLR
jgi:hypothetical protein